MTKGLLPTKTSKRATRPSRKTDKPDAARATPLNFKVPAGFHREDVRKISHRLTASRSAWHLERRALEGHMDLQGCSARSECIRPRCTLVRVVGSNDLRRSNHLRLEAQAETTQGLSAFPSPAFLNVYCVALSVFRDSDLVPKAEEE